MIFGIPFFYFIYRRCGPLSGGFSGDVTRVTHHENTTFS